MDDEKPLNIVIKDLLLNSSNLIHLDLSNTMLKGSSVMTLVQCLKKSLTLMSLHLTGNTVTRQIKAVIKNQLKAKKHHVKSE